MLYEFLTETNRKTSTPIDISHAMDAGAMKILLLGDSDIARWPLALLPEWTICFDPNNDNCNDNHNGVVPVRTKARVNVQGYSGATLEQVVDRFDTSFLHHDTDTNPTIVVFCAGENDIGNGIPLQETLRALDTLLDAMALSSDPCTRNRRLIVLGPKLEPWLNDDLASRKQYIRLSKGMQRHCLKRSNTTFCDCVFLFCDDARRADPKFFDKDQLHLNERGYQVWKGIIEEELQKWINTTATKE